MSTDLILRLRSLSQGFEEWRVEHPETGSYCMSYTYDDASWPEQAARDWLAAHLAVHPDSNFAAFVVKKHVVKTRKDQALDEAADALERLTVEHHNMRARLGRAVCAAEEHFGEDAIRYKLSLFANGRARNVFPRNVDGHWFALQRADNDAHIGLSLRCLEAEAERDNLRHELEQLKRDHDSQGGMLALVKQRRDELEAGA